MTKIMTMTFTGTKTCPFCYCNHAIYHGHWSLVTEILHACDAFEEPVPILYWNWNFVTLLLVGAGAGVRSVQRRGNVEQGNRLSSSLPLPPRLSLQLASAIFIRWSPVNQTQVEFSLGWGERLKWGVWYELWRLVYIWDASGWPVLCLWWGTM